MTPDMVANSLGITPCWMEPGQNFAGWRWGFPPWSCTTVTPLGEKRSGFPCSTRSDGQINGISKDDGSCGQVCSGDDIFDVTLTKCGPESAFKTPCSTRPDGIMNGIKEQNGPCVSACEGSNMLSSDGQNCVPIQNPCPAGQSPADPRNIRSQCVPDNVPVSPTTPTGATKPTGPTPGPQTTPTGKTTPTGQQSTTPSGKTGETGKKPTGKTGETGKTPTGKDKPAGVKKEDDNTVWWIVGGLAAAAAIGGGVYYMQKKKKEEAQRGLPGSRPATRMPNYYR
jgi:hypothetical protein